MWAFLYKLGSPRYFYELTGRWLPWIIALMLLLFAYGLIGGLWLAPADYQQGDAFRIIYVHVPSALLSMGIYTYLTFCAVLSLVWRIKIADIMIKVSAPIGAWMCFLSLFTGAVWGKPMWGTWWIWDARLTSQLILLFIYIAIIALQNSLSKNSQGHRAVSIFVIVGFIDIPIIHYSVYWWNTLHQGATITRFAKPAISGEMLYPLLAMLAAFFCYFLAVAFLKARNELLLRDKNTAWVNEIVFKGAKL